jgi:hypothetical protein
MERDEDIDIIDPYEGHQNSDSPPQFIIKSGPDENPQASHHALFQAYEVDNIYVLISFHDIQQTLNYTLLKKKC